MPGYELKLTVIDEGAHGAALRRRIPELKDRMNEVGESIYTFTYLENCDFDSEEFEQMVRDHCPKYTFAFVATDRNVTNIDLGLRLNVLRGRLNNGSDYHIRICTDHTELSENWSPKLRDRIKLVGGIREVYDYEFITMSRIETAAKQLHLIRQADKQNDGQGGEAQEPVAWEEYCNDEYKRRSVFARALAIKYKIEVIRRMGLSTEVTCSDDLWICYEHMRWNMYTRSLGYACTGNTGLASDPPGPEDRRYSKVHECLVPYEQLSQDNKNKDKIKLTREVLEIYEGHHTD